MVNDIVVVRTCRGDDGCSVGKSCTGGGSQNIEHSLVGEVLLTFLDLL